MKTLRMANDAAEKIHFLKLAQERTIMNSIFMLSVH